MTPPGDVRCLVVGAGEMGRAHIAVLRHLGAGALHVFAASERNRRAVEALSVGFSHGDMDAAVANFGPTHSIVAGPVDTLASCTLRLLEMGINHLLVEKPAAITARETALLRRKVEQSGAIVRVGYNRQFYASVRKALAMIEESGESIASLSFEFTEWSDVVCAHTNQSVATKARWLTANSLHVVDLAFLLSGLPDRARSLFVARGALDWHPTSIFAGAGVTTKDIPFSYTANWDGPGRWSVEWVTRSARYIFRPMEKLHVMRRGSVAISEISLDDGLDQQFKPGLYRQDRAFLTGEDLDRLPNLEHALALVELAGAIADYER